MTEKRKRAAKPKYEVICEYREWLESQGFKFEWLDKLNADYGFDKFEYIPKFKAFRCYKEEQHLDWADVNDVAMLNALNIEYEAAYHNGESGVIKFILHLIKQAERV